MDKQDILEFNGKINEKEKNISLIFPGLYLGNYRGALDQEKLKSMGISTILSCGTQKIRTEMNYMWFELADSWDANLIEVLSDATQYIHTYLSLGGKVYVHCQGGFSRSPSVIIAYLMEYKGFTFDEALRFVKKRRPSIKPNEGFITQLKSRKWY